MKTRRWQDYSDRNRWGTQVEASNLTSSVQRLA